MSDIHKRPHWWHILLLWALLGAAYSNSFHTALVFDGAKIVTQDSRLHAATPENLGLIFSQEYWYQGAPSGLYRPLTTLSFLADYVLGNGVDPASYHFTNFALHLINVTLVYALGLFIFDDPKRALALAGLWGLHPLLTDSVTNIAGRADLLAAFGVLAGLLCYLKSTSATGARKLLWLAALAAAQAVGLSAKENAAVLPGLMLLYDVAWPDRSTVRVRIPAYATLALPFAVWLFLRSQAPTHMAIHFLENPLVSASFLTARLTAIKVIGKILWLFVWPARLSADYSYNAIPLFGWHYFDWEDGKALLALALCLGAAVLLWRWRTTRARLFFFLAFFFVALAPTANVFLLIGSIFGERFAYLPSIGLAGCAVAALHLFSRSRAAWIALAVICLALAARTYARNLDWRDDLTFWTSTVASTPESARPHNNLGNALLTTPGRLPDAIAQFETALSIWPDYTDAHYNLGSALAQMPDRLPEALAHYQEAVWLEPDFAQAHINFGNLLARTPGRANDAIAEYHAALRADPRLAEAHFNLGSLFSQMPGRIPDAVAELQAAIQLQPHSARPHNSLGSLYSQMPGRAADAIAEYQAALGADPNSFRAHYNLANLLSQMRGRRDEAIAEYRTTLRLQPDFAGAHNNLANLFLQTPGRLADAIVEYQMALRSDPNLVEAHANLASALAQIPGRRADAIAEYEAALRITPDPEIRRRLERLK